MKKLLAGAAIVLVALGALATDFYLQARKYDDRFGGPQYVATLFDRLDGGPGYVGLIFRKSLMVSSAFPPAPRGWTEHTWSTVPYDGLYSATQMEVIDRHIELAVEGRELMVTGTEEAIIDGYNDDLARVYLSHGGAYIDFQIKVRGIDLPRQAWRDYYQKVDDYFDRVDRITPFGTIQGVTWYERRGPIEEASNDRLPHRLRAFEANLGNVELTMYTRVADDNLKMFMEEMDLSYLHRINELPGENLALEISMANRDHALVMAEGRTSTASVASGRAVVVQRGGGCSGGVFC